METVRDCVSRRHGHRVHILYTLHVLHCRLSGNKTCWPSSGSMLVHRLRRWPTLIQCVVLGWLYWSRLRRPKKTSLERKVSTYTWRDKHTYRFTLPCKVQSGICSLFMWAVTTVCLCMAVLFFLRTVQIIQVSIGRYRSIWYRWRPGVRRGERRSTDDRLSPWSGDAARLMLW